MLRIALLDMIASLNAFLNSLKLINPKLSPKREILDAQRPINISNNFMTTSVMLHIL